MLYIIITVIKNAVIKTKLRIIDVLFSGGLSEKMPPIASIEKKPANPIKTNTKIIAVRNHASLDCEKLEKIELLGLFLKINTSFIKNANNNNNGAVKNISYPKVALNPFGLKICNMIATTKKVKMAKIKNLYDNRSLTVDEEDRSLTVDEEDGSLKVNEEDRRLNQSLNQSLTKVGDIYICKVGKKLSIFIFILILYNIKFTYFPLPFFLRDILYKEQLNL